MKIKRIIMHGSSKACFLFVLVLLVSCDVSRRLYMEESGKDGIQPSLTLDGVELSSAVFQDKVLLLFKNTVDNKVTICLDSLHLSFPDGNQFGLTTLIEAQYYKGVVDNEFVFKTYELYLKFDDIQLLKNNYMSIFPCNFLTNKRGERIINDTIKVFLDPRYPYYLKNK